MKKASLWGLVVLCLIGVGCRPAPSAEPTSAAPEPNDLTPMLLEEAPTLPPPTPTETPPPATATPLPSPSPTPALQAQLAEESNMRAGPGFGFEVIARVPTDNPVTLLGRDESGDWLQISTQGGQQGWMAATQLILEGDAASLPLIAETSQAPQSAQQQQAAEDADPQPAPAPGPTAAPAAGSIPANQDLLQNGSFEQPYNPDQRLDGGGLIAWGWSAWWFNDEGDYYDGPEFKMANLAVDPFRVRTGEDAQQLFRPHARHQGGVWQTVTVYPGARVRFNVYGHAWSTDAEKPNPRNSRDGGNTGDMYMKVGIDPTGGTNPQAAAVVWSQERFVYDNFEEFSVEAVAEAERVTVFTYSSNAYPVGTNNVYWDDAALIILP